jgi:hypothetical protein
MVWAASKGQEAIVRLCHDEWGASNVDSVNKAMSWAASKGQEAIVRLCHDEWAPMMRKV